MCVITNGDNLKCWSYLVKPFIPGSFRSNIKHVTIRNYIVCAITIDDKLGCWFIISRSKTIILNIDNVFDVGIQ